jgi:hypothetical protein
LHQDAYCSAFDAAARIWQGTSRAKGLGLDGI